MHDQTYRVTLIVPYFGRLPGYFELWARSCEANQNYEWLIFTDHVDHGYRLPANVRTIPSTLDDIRQRLMDRTGMSAALTTPYKVCDVRPMYGKMFDDYLSNSTHWGYTDLDVIYGRLEHFLTPEILYSFPRILRRGHLSIFRNDDISNNLYKLQKPGIDIEAILRGPETITFDEWGGLNPLMEHNSVPVYKEEIVSDFNHNSGHLIRTVEPNYGKQVFYWENGSVYQEFVMQGKRDRTEWAYMHFQKRPMKAPTVDPWKVNGFYITPTGFAEKPAGPLDAAAFGRFNPAYRSYRFRRFCRRVARKAKSVLGMS